MGSGDNVNERNTEKKCDVLLSVDITVNVKRREQGAMVCETTTTARTVVRTVWWKEQVGGACVRIVVNVPSAKTADESEREEVRDLTHG